MTTYAPNFTPRYRLKYHVCGIDHTMQLRAAVGANAIVTADLQSTAFELFSTWASQICNDLAFISAEQADQDSDEFYPSTLPLAVVGSVGAPSTYTPFQKITHTRFAGKARGSRAALELYGIKWNYADAAEDSNTIPYDGQVFAAEDARINSSIARLNGFAFANSGQATVWYPKATVKVNDYWLRQLRKGSIS